MQTKFVKFAFVVTFAFGLLPLTAYAGPATDAFSKCLGDSTTGKDRIALAKWVFVAMTSHPDLAGLSAVTPAEKEASNRQTGDLITRLMTHDCLVEGKAATTQDGPTATKTGFEFLGRLAMNELISNQTVAANFNSIAGYLDKQKFKDAYGMK